jgi:hypothetical protein
MTLNAYDPCSWFWIVQGDEGRAYSSSAGAYVDASQADPARTTRIDTEENMIAVLRAANVPPYHRVPKSVILSRLGDERAAQAFALATVGQQLRWNAPDKTFINADDPEVRALLAAIGADAAEILVAE